MGRGVLICPSLLALVVKLLGLFFNFQSSGIVNGFFSQRLRSALSGGKAGSNCRGPGYMVENRLEVGCGRVRAQNLCVRVIRPSRDEQDASRIEEDARHI